MANGQPSVIKREEQKGGRSRRKEHEEGTKEKSRNELQGGREAGARDEQDNLLMPGFWIKPGEPGKQPATIDDKMVVNQSFLETYPLELKIETWSLEN